MQRQLPRLGKLGLPHRQCARGQIDIAVSQRQRLGDNILCIFNLLRLPGWQRGGGGRLRAVTFAKLGRRSDVSGAATGTCS